MQHPLEARSENIRESEFSFHWSWLFHQERKIIVQIVSFRVLFGKDFRLDYGFLALALILGFHRICIDSNFPKISHQHITVTMSDENSLCAGFFNRAQQ